MVFFFYKFGVEKLKGKGRRTRASYIRFAFFSIFFFSSPLVPASVVVGQASLAVLVVEQLLHGLRAAEHGRPDERRGAVAVARHLGVGAELQEQPESK